MVCFCHKLAKLFPLNPPINESCNNLESDKDYLSMLPLSYMAADHCPVVRHTMEGSHTFVVSYSLAGSHTQDVDHTMEGPMLVVYTPAVTCTLVFISNLAGNNSPVIVPNANA